MPFDNAAEYLPLNIQMLLGADRLLAKPENWLKGNLDDGRGGFCLLGALLQASEDMGLSRQNGFTAPVGYICKARQGSGWIAAYNNAAGTTFEDIKSVLAEAIELESAKVAA